MVVDNVADAVDCQSDPRADRNRGARRDNPPPTDGGTSYEQATSREDAETKRLLEEFRALVTPTLWERV